MVLVLIFFNVVSLWVVIGTFYVEKIAIITYHKDQVHYTMGNPLDGFFIPISNINMIKENKATDTFDIE